MPVARPTCRKVLDVPVAMPLCAGRTTETVAEARTGLVMPVPMPARMKPGRRTVQVESAWTSVISRHPRATQNSPRPKR